MARFLFSFSFPVIHFFCWLTCPPRCCACPLFLQCSMRASSVTLLYSIQTFPPEPCLSSKKTGCGMSVDMACKPTAAAACFALPFLPFPFPSLSLSPGAEAVCDFITAVADCCVSRRALDTGSVFSPRSRTPQRGAGVANAASLRRFALRERAAGRGSRSCATAPPLYSMTLWSSGYAALSHE